MTKLRKGNLLLAKTSSKKFLSNLTEPYSTRLGESWSRVRIESEVPGATGDSKFDMRICYLDFGVYDTILVNVVDGDSLQYDDYQFAKMPDLYKMCPAFNYTIRLSRVRKLRIFIA